MPACLSWALSQPRVTLLTKSSLLVFLSPLYDRQYSCGKGRIAVSVPRSCVPAKHAERRGRDHTTTVFLIPAFPLSAPTLDCWQARASAWILNCCPLTEAWAQRTEGGSQRSPPPSQKLSGTGTAQFSHVTRLLAEGCAGAVSVPG